jgi:peptide/nickel transport system substrate-binding protein
VAGVVGGVVVLAGIGVFAAMRRRSTAEDRE